MLTKVVEGCLNSTLALLSSPELSTNFHLKTIDYTVHITGLQIFGHSNKFCLGIYLYVVGILIACNVANLILSVFSDI